MVHHGFGIGEITGKNEKLLTKTDKEDIAKCISKVSGVLWAHIVHDQFSGQDRFDFIWEEKHECNESKIKSCAPIGCEIRIKDRITIEDESFKGGNPGKHPKDE